MVESHGVRLHLDSPACFGGEREFVVTGWAIGHESIQSVQLTSSPKANFKICERPDVVLAFPAFSHVVGFSGSGNQQDISNGQIQLTVRIGESVVGIAHPVPSAPRAGTLSRLYAGFMGGLLRFGERWSNEPARRWSLVLRRHLWERRARAGFFIRIHAETLLNDFARSYPAATFIQIGANDGLTGDPLREILGGASVRWRGLLVEPVAHLFTKLEERHRQHPELKLERAAIGEEDGQVEIFRLRTRPEDPIWLEQLATLDLAVLRRTAAPVRDLEDRIVREMVPAYSVATLLLRHGIEHTDLLVIDTEGWDWRVLRQFQLDRLQPRLIIYEHQHLTSVDRDAAHAFLKAGNYGWAETPEGDTIAWRLS